jgi:hypothetical protein
VRRSLALSALLALAFAPLASAAPNVGPESGAGTQFRLTTRAGVYTVSLLAGTPAGGGAPVLRVRIQSSAGSAKRFAGALPATALVTRGGTTTLSTRFGSLPLRVAFHPQTPVVAASFGDVDSDNGLAAGWVIAGNGGTADVALGGVRCTVAFMVIGTATVVDSGSYGRPPATALGLPLKGARCDDVPSTPLPVP